MGFSTPATREVTIPDEEPLVIPDFPDDPDPVVAPQAPDRSPEPELVPA